MNNGEFDNGSGGGGDGGPVEVAAAAVVDDRDGVQWQRWCGHFMAAVAFNGIQR